MIKYKRILFPVDLHESADVIIPHVAALTAGSQAELHLLYVAGANEYFVEDEEKPGAGITRSLEAFRDQHLTGIGCTRVAVVDGEVAAEILGYIEKAKIDMVVMAIKGKTALGKAVFGSTAGQIVRSAGVPVVLINPAQSRFWKNYDE